MKKLFFGIVILSALSLHAQTVATNIIAIRWTVDGTNVTANATQPMVQGLWLAYQKNIQVNGTNAPAFPQFVRQESIDRLSGLQNEAAADEQATNKINQLGIPISIWQQLTASQKTNVIGIFKPLLP